MGFLNLGFTKFRMESQRTRLRSLVKPRTRNMLPRLFMNATRHGVGWSRVRCLNKLLLTISPCKSPPRAQTHHFSFISAIFFLVATSPLPTLLDLSGGMTPVILVYLLILGNPLCLLILLVSLNSFLKKDNLAVVSYELPSLEMVLYLFRSGLVTSKLSCRKKYILFCSPR